LDSGGAARCCQKIKFARLEHDFKDLKEKFSEEAKERKNLYNKLIEIKGNENMHNPLMKESINGVANSTRGNGKTGVRTQGGSCFKV